MNVKWLKEFTKDTRGNPTQHSHTHTSPPPPTHTNTHKFLESPKEVGNTVLSEPADNLFGTKTNLLKKTHKPNG